MLEYDPLVAKHFKSINSAVIFQRILWSIQTHMANPAEYSGLFYGDNWWMCDTYNAFAEYSGLSPSQVKRAIKKLKDSGLLISSKFKSHKWNQTKYYSIDKKAYEALHFCLHLRKPNL